MSKGEASIIWNELDPYRYGFCTAGALQNWMMDNANFQVPHTEVHFLHNCFNAGDRITQDQFLSKLSMAEEEGGE